MSHPPLSPAGKRQRTMDVDMSRPTSSISLPRDVTINPIPSSQSSSSQASSLILNLRESSNNQTEASGQSRRRPGQRHHPIGWQRSRFIEPPTRRLGLDFEDEEVNNDFDGFIYESDSSISQPGINAEDSEHPGAGYTESSDSSSDISSDAEPSHRIRINFNNNAVEPVSDSGSDHADDLRRDIFDDAESQGDNNTDYEYNSDCSEDTIENSLPEEYLRHDPTPNTQYPRPDWITVKELLYRKCGFASTRMRQTNPYWFERYANNSLWMIQRLELSKRLGEHRGCINAINFNSSGKLLCSAGDDLDVRIWDWQSGGLVRKLTSGHQFSIFHSEFFDNDSQVITSSRDGTVRVINIESGQSEVILARAGDIDKLAFLTPQTVVTCGMDGYVNMIDLRTKKHQKLFQVKSPSGGEVVGLHTISPHPMDKDRLVVAGESAYVFLYDLRRSDREPKLTHCINQQDNWGNFITSIAFNALGDRLLVSYNDGDLFVCKPDTFEALHRYTGHQNKRTIKGCAWFGDNFVISGSDDGHIYGWDVDSEHIVCFLEGDVKGIVNSLAVHPQLPVLASSGLDLSVKVWEPISKVWPQTLKGIKPQICKNALRRKRKKIGTMMINLRQDFMDDSEESESSTR